MVEALDRAAPSPAPEGDPVEELTRTVANLRVALDSSRMIGAAVGILMERRKLTYAEAFRALVAASQHSHRKLREIAEHLVYTGELPPNW